MKKKPSQISAKVRLDIAKKVSVIHYGPDGATLTEAHLVETGKNVGGRPPTLTPCPYCINEYGARELRAHLPKCEMRPRQGKV